MRMFLVVLAACGAPVATPGPAPLAGRSVAPASGPAPSWIRARIAVDTTSWLEISIKGNTAETPARCMQLVKDVLAVGGRRLLRDCDAAELPRPPWQPPVLVTVDDEISMFQPFSDLDACERARAQLAADDDRIRVEFERTRIADIVQRLPAAQHDEVVACENMHTAYRGCGNLHDSARTQCLLDAQPSKLTCDEMTRRRTQLEAERRAQPHPPARRYACQDR